MVYVLGGVDYDLVPRDNAYELSEESGIKELKKMNYSRYRCGTAFANGRIYIIGGYTELGITASVESYHITGE